MDTEKTPFESFPPFTPDPPPAGKSEPEKKTRGRKKTADKLPTPSPVPATQGKKPRAARKASTRKARQPRAAHLTVSAAIIAFSGLSMSEADLTGKMVIALQGVPKKARGRIVEALKKVFS